MPPATAKPSRRTHITTACTACRESKIKCDGRQPKCGNCMKGRMKQCIYQGGEDKRRISLRKAIHVFSKRVQQLEQFIQNNNLEIPPIYRDDEAWIKKLLDTIDPLPCSSPEGQIEQSMDRHHDAPESVPSLPHDPLVPLTEQLNFNASAMDGLNESQDTLNSLNTFMNINNDDIMRGAGQQPLKFTSLDPTFGLDMGSPDWYNVYSELRTLPSRVTGGWDASRTAAAQDLDIEESEESSDEDPDGIIHQISERMGSLQIGEDGELRYFGATSNLHLLDDMSSQAGFGSHSLRSLGAARIEESGLNQTIDSGLISHLINLYYAWQDPSFHIVDKEMFEDKRALYDDGKDDSTFYSETLINSMCAFGALYETKRQSGMPTPLSDYFAKRALTWLEVELDCPRVATIQALTLLSSYMAAFTRDTRGWLYSGMSMRLALDLGLHIDMSPYVKNGLMSKAEADVRKTVFWGSFVVDHLWGFYLGRPVHIRIDDISVEKPSKAPEALAQVEWIPYGISNLPSRSSSNSANRLVSNELILRQWVRLCETMSGLSHALYGCVNVTKTALQAQAENTVAKLHEWLSDLPQELQVDFQDQAKDYLPHVLVLHMQYHQFQIYIHRPFISKYSSQPYPPVGPGHAHARNTCIESAVAISELLCQYKSRYTLRFVNIEVVSITFSAALILIFATVSEITGYDKVTLTKHLTNCCQALAELGNVFQNATRTLELLLSIKRAWQAKLIANAGSKRRSSGLTKPSSTSRKRTRSRAAQPEPGFDIGSKGIIDPPSQSNFVSPQQESQSQLDGMNQDTWSEITVSLNGGVEIEFGEHIDAV